MYQLRQIYYGSHSSYLIAQLVGRKVRKCFMLVAIGRHLSLPTLLIYQNSTAVLLRCHKIHLKGLCGGGLFLLHVTFAHCRIYE